MKLSFYGAAGEVTGSCYLVQTETFRFLVDCGMFQGGHEADLKNRQFPAFDPASIDFVLLTHAHIDHSGLLPRLAALGFQGPIYCTAATAELLDVMLRDSAHIQEKEAEWEERHNNHRNNRRPRFEPLYSLADVEKSLKLLHRLNYDAEIRPHPDVTCSFRDAGHILGSAIIEIWAEEFGQRRKIVFSGDLGQPGRPLLRNPTSIRQADVLLVESTYGNRLHKMLPDTLDELVHAIHDTLERKHGNVVMPAFTVGRTQEILYLLIDLTRQRRLHGLKVYVDSPLALSATEITMRHIELFNQEAQKLMAWGKERRKEMPEIRFVQDVEESMALNEIKSGAIIISASGMCDAGRIKHHLRWNLSRPECSILITGFQALGTLGRRLVDGAKLVKLFGNEIPVRASIYTIGGLSAHADQASLMGWLSHFSKPPQQTFVVHGESAAAEIFANRVRDELNWNVRVPELHEELEI
ncbi:MAG TPA: MBL fold metallo-hydrolase [Novimethylophilus sp.]|jgi:metallo-beta-lactamase family protein|uniref:MBL fold metallo-hydrolase n=1 Tax=Novimethylophilus sp. TaxID=2137426 RepID=UPI002F425005